MSIGRNTIETPLGEMQADQACPYCGKPLTKTSVVANGRMYAGLPCWGSCGCGRAQFQGEQLTNRERRYRMAGIGARFLDVDVELGDYLGKVLDGRSLYVQGNNGSGKTAFASALARAVLDSEKAPGVRYSARFENSRAVISEMQGVYDGRRSDVLERMSSCDVLFLDDLGKEQPTEYAISMLYQVIDARYAECRPIVVTTNFTRGELAERLARRDAATAEAIVSRLCDGVEVVNIYGDDRRMA